QQRVWRERIGERERGCVVRIAPIERIAKILVDVIEACHHVAPDLRLDAGGELVLARSPPRDQRWRLVEAAAEGRGGRDAPSADVPGDPGAGQDVGAFREPVPLE